MKCIGGEASSHKACFCREKYFSSEKQRMIRAFQEIQEFVKTSFGVNLKAQKAIYEICREAIATREAK